MARASRELFYIEDHLIQDADAHNAILDDGDDARARAVSDRLAKTLGLSDAEIAALRGSDTRSKAWDESEHPRHPPGSAEGGQFAPAGGGGASGAADEKPLLIGTGTDPERLSKWTSEIAAQQDKLETGSDEENKLQRLRTAIELYQAADAKTKTAGHATLYEVHDPDGNLKAAVFSQFNPKTRVTTIEGLGGLDHDAIVKALKFTVQHAQETNRAERIEKVEFDDEKEAIAAMEAAGFRKRPDQSGHGVTTLIIGEETTPGEKEQLERIASAHEMRILGAAQATAMLLGYGSHKVEISNADYNFTIGGESKQRTAAGLAHLDTGMITIFPKHIVSVEATAEVTSHEVAHQKYQTVLRAEEAERKQLMAEAQQVRASTGESIMKPDGSLNPPYDAKYPIYTRMLRHAFTLDRRIKSDGVTDYSKAYWEQAKPGTPNQVRISTAEHETIAEMAAQLTRTGKLPGSREWKAYYKDIMKTYGELQAQKVKT